MLAKAHLLSLDGGKWVFGKAFDVFGGPIVPGWSENWMCLVLGQAGRQWPAIRQAKADGQGLEPEGSPSFVGE